MCEEIVSTNKVINYNKENVYIPTGIFAIDYGLFRHGGLPVGKKIELFGSEGSGKTTLAMNLAKNTIKLGGKVLLYDIEEWDNNRIKQILPFSEEELTNSIIHRNILTIEDLKYDLITNFFKPYHKKKSDTLWTIIVDSIAFALPQDYIDAAEKQRNERIASQSSVLTKLFTLLNSYIKDTRVLFVFINQPRVDIKGATSMFKAEDRYKTVASKAFLHFCDARIQLYVGKKEEENGLKIGHYLTVSSEAKNKIEAPTRNYKYLQYFNGRVGNYYTIFEIADENNLFEKSGSWYKYIDSKGNEHKFQGKNKFKEQSKEMIEEITKDVISIIEKDFKFVENVGKEEEINNDEK